MAWRRRGEGSAEGSDEGSGEGEDEFPEVPLTEGDVVVDVPPSTEPFERPAPFSVRRVPIPEEPASRRSPPPPDEAEDPLAKFLPVDTPFVHRRHGGRFTQLTQLVREAPAWQKGLAAAALILALLVVGFALFGGEPAVVDQTIPSPAAPPPPTPAPPSVVPTAAPVPGLVDKNCSDFASQREAQNFYREAGGPAQDLHGIDPDKNSKACDEPNSGVGGGASVTPAASPSAPAAATSTAQASP